MTDHAAETKAGPALLVAAASALASVAFALFYLVSILLAGLGVALLRELGSVSLVGLVIAAPVAIAASFVVRCEACDRLVIPLVYDGKSLFSPKAPSAWAIGKTALMVVLHQHAPCPHCGSDVSV